MGLQISISKDETLYQQVSYGNVEGIKALRRDGAGLEWIDREGKTPLIVACMRPDFANVAKVLMELGANVNAYRPAALGSHAGTPLHHAAKRGLDHTVQLLLHHGANALIMNDDCVTPLDVARSKGHSKVVRVIEAHIHLFSGWLRELHGPGFLEALAPQWMGSETRYKFLAANEGDKQQLLWFYNACRGIRQVTAPPPVPPTREDLELAMAINASIQSAMQERPPVIIPTQQGSQASDMNGWASSTNSASCNGWGPPQGLPPPSKPSSSGSVDTPASGDAYNGWGAPDCGANASQTKQQQQHTLTDSSASAPSIPQGIPSIPSAPPIPTDGVDEGPIHYPSIDSSPIDLSMPAVEMKPLNDGGNGSGFCAICLDAPKEVVCVPCGHVVGCLPCLSDIKVKNLGCPICRAKIDQVIKIFNV
ncbi:hypothetical protein ACLOJK_009644 [Asimina triloba]